MDERAEAQRNEGSFPRPSELLPFESRAHPLNRQSLAYPGIKWESCPHFGSCSFHVEHRRLTNDRQNSSRELSSLGAHICEELSGGKGSDREWQVETAGKQISAPIVKNFLTPRAAHKNEWVDREAGSSPRLEEIPKSNGWVGVDDSIPFQLEFVQSTQNLSREINTKGWLQSCSLSHYYHQLQTDVGSG